MHDRKSVKKSWIAREFWTWQPGIYNSRSRILQKVQLKKNKTASGTVVVNTRKSRCTVLQVKDSTFFSIIIIPFKVQLFIMRSIFLLCPWKDIRVLHVRSYTVTYGSCFRTLCPHICYRLPENVLYRCLTYKCQNLFPYRPSLLPSQRQSSEYVNLGLLLLCHFNTDLIGRFCYFVTSVLILLEDFFYFVTSVMILLEDFVTF